jgi:hypothetical protein
MTEIDIQASTGEKSAHKELKSCRRQYFEEYEKARCFVVECGSEDLFARSLEQRLIQRMLPC